MEFKIKDKKIQDVKKYALWGQSAMVVTLDANGNKTLVFGAGERSRAFILYLIEMIHKEVKEGKKLEDCDNYKILDNYLNMLLVQLDLSCGQWAGQYSQHIMKFIEEKMDTAEPLEVSDEEEKHALSEAGLLEKAIKEVYKNNN